MRLTFSSKLPRPALFLEQLEGRALPGFLAPLRFDTGALPLGMAVGDFDDDNTADLAVANYLASGLAVVHLACSQP